MFLRAFVRDDWPWVRTWFQDESLNQALGPVDEAWLDHVISDPGGAQLVAVLDGKPVALIGCEWAHDTGSLHVLTDLAIDPAARRRRLGAQAVDLLLDWPDQPPGSGWAAFVDPVNHAARAFFAAQGWASAGEDDGMLRFEFIAG